MKSTHKLLEVNHLKNDAILLTSIQAILNELINRVGSQENPKDDLLMIQDLINKDPHCVDLTDSEGNSTLYYVEKLRKLRWKASNNYYMTLIIQICDIVEKRCLMNNLIFFYWCMKNMDYAIIIQFPVVDILRNVVQVASILQPLKSDDENFNKFFGLLDNYCDPSSVDFSGFERKHILEAKEIIGMKEISYLKDSFFFSDFGIGYILFLLSKIKMNPNDGFVHIIRTTKDITGYSDPHFKKGDDYLKLLFEIGYDSLKERGFLKPHSWMDVISSVFVVLCFNRKLSINLGIDQIDQYLKILLNSGLITNSDIVNSALNNLRPDTSIRDLNYYLYRHLIACHLNELSKYEVADIVNYLIDRRDYDLLYHLFFNLKNRNTLEIHKNNLLKRFMDEAKDVYPEDIGKIIKLLIQAEPSCLKQLQDLEIQGLCTKYALNDLIEQVTHAEFERPVSNAFFQPATVIEVSEIGGAMDTPQLS